MTMLDFERLGGVLFAHFPGCGLSLDHRAGLLRLWPGGQRDAGEWTIPLCTPFADVQRECVVYLVGHARGLAQHAAA